MFDVLVVGDGVAGLTAAALFAAADRQVALLGRDQGTRARPRDGVPPSVAITPGSVRVLSAVDAWRHVDAACCGRFDAIEVWDAASTGRVQITPPPGQRSTMGWIVASPALEHAADAACNAAGVTRLEGRALALDVAPHPVLHLDSGESVTARLLVGADGAASAVRRLAGLDLPQEAYGQTAIVANVETELPHGQVARQRFLPSGPLAFLPLSAPHAASVVWSLDTALAGELMALDDAAFRARLGAAFEMTLGAVTACSPRAAHPLSHGRVAQWTRGGCVLIGDAAHVVHPLAGQGLNLGIADAAALYECLSASHQSWPTAPALRRFERWRKSEALALDTLTAGLNRLFADQHAGVRALRGAGMRLTDRSNALKQHLALRAMGLAGDMPAMMRQPGNAR